MATISFVADVIAIVGIPALAVSTAKLYKDAKRAREPQSVGHECLGFFDLDLEMMSTSSKVHAQGASIDLDSMLDV